MKKTILLIWLLLLLVSAPCFSVGVNIYPVWVDGELILDGTIDDDALDFVDITLADLTDDVGYLRADGTVDLTDNWTIATKSITLTAGTLTTEGFNADGGTIHVDAVTHRVGVGTVTPLGLIHGVYNDGSIAYGLRFESGAAVGAGGILIDSANNADVIIDRGAATRLSTTTYKTAGSTNWRTGLTDSDVAAFDGTEFFIGQSATTPEFVIETTGNVGIGTTAPDSIFHIKANVAGEVGSHPAGQLIIQDPDDTVFGNAVITGYESDGAGNPDQQLWYLGSSSISNSNIIFLNRRNSKLQLGTNDVSRLTILGNGNVGIGTVTPTAALQMGDDKLIAFDTNAGLTASTTQSQGQGALTAQINEVSTVANKDDTVTLPSAITGVEIEIINNGVNTLQIFPASGDDLGLGVDTAEELQANERVKFVAYDTTNWAKENTTEIIHAEIHDEDNTDAFVINAFPDFHSYHTNGLAAGDLADWAFDVGGAGTSFAIASIVDAGGGDITVTTTGLHGLEVGDIISQTNLTDAAYVGVFDVLTVPATTTYTVTAAYTATGTGTMDQAATLEADAVAAGVYSFAYYISGKPVGNQETFDFQLYKEATAVIGSKIRRKFGAQNDFGSMSGGGIVSIANGDKISLAISNEDSAANLTIRNLTIVLLRL